MRRLAPAAVLFTSVGLLAFSFADPDRRVAERNVDRWRATGHLDLEYLSGLTPTPCRRSSSSLAPSAWTTARIRQSLADDDPWSSANRSRSRARDLLRS
ncbi:MAG: DUF4173 domain-containing protein [Actinobacteria bacterium]|nr:DUF4173 domain-containing protein [Actinomycetota bacterium]